MVFGDSSGFIAAFDRRDASHAAAARAWQEIARRRERILTTWLVFGETVTFLRRRAGWRLSRQVGEALLASPAVEIARLDDDELRAAWRELVPSPDPKLSLCDAASFVVMRDRGVTRALSLDRHFVDAGFELLTKP